MKKDFWDDFPYPLQMKNIDESVRYWDRRSPSEWAEFMRNYDESVFPVNDWELGGKIKGQRVRFSCTIRVTEKEKMRLQKMVQDTYVKLKEIGSTRVQIRVDRYMRGKPESDYSEAPSEKMLDVGPKKMNKSIEYRDDGDDNEKTNSMLDIMHYKNDGVGIPWTVFSGNDKSAGGWDFNKVMHFLYMGYFDIYSSHGYCKISKKPFIFWKPVFDRCDPVNGLALKDAIRADDGFSEDIVCNRKKI